MCARPSAEDAMEIRAADRSHRAAARELLHEEGEDREALPAAVKFIEDNKLNEFFDGDLTTLAS